MERERFSSCKFRLIKARGVMMKVTSRTFALFPIAQHRLAQIPRQRNEI